MRCVNCGNELPDIATFCNKCGSNVRKLTSEKKNAEPSATSTVSSSSSSLKINMNKPTSDKVIPKIDYSILGDGAEPEERSYVHNDVNKSMEASSDSFGEVGETRMFDPSLVREALETKRMSSSATNHESVFYEGKKKTAVEDKLNTHTLSSSSDRLSKESVFASYGDSVYTDGLSRRVPSEDDTVFKTGNTEKINSESVYSQVDIPPISPVERYDKIGKNSDELLSSDQVVSMDDKSGKFPAYIFRIVGTVLLWAMVALVTVDVFASFFDIKDHAYANNYGIFLLYYFLIWVIFPMDMFAIKLLSKKRKSTQIVISIQFIVAFLIVYLLEEVCIPVTPTSIMFLEMAGVYISHIWINISLTACALVCYGVDLIFDKR